MIDDDDAADTLTPADADLMALEAYLDGELDPAEAAAVAARLAADPRLAARLAEERAGRAVALATLEPDAVAVERLQWRVRGAVAAARRPAGRPSFWTARVDPWRLTRITAAAAACVVFGFVGGRLGRGPVATAPQPSVAQAGADPSPAVVAASGGGADVPLFDNYGRMVARQHFDTPEKARQFMDDLHRTEAPGAAGAAGPAHLASEIRY